MTTNSSQAKSASALHHLEFLTSFKSMPLMSLPVRTVVARLDNARVLLSPGSMLSEEQLASCGNVTDIVAPNLFHTAGMKQAAQVFPQAKLWGPVGCEKKHPTLPWAGHPGVDAWPHETELSVVALGGMSKFRESVFVHHASRSLLVSDLVFNLEDATGAGAWFFLNLFGTWRRLAVSKLFVKQIDDRAAFRASVAQLMAFEFDHLVPAHGAVVSSEAKSRLGAALRERGLV